MDQETQNDIEFQKCQSCGATLMECTCSTVLNPELAKNVEKANVEELANRITATGYHKPGKILNGRYAIKKVIGVGGMGTVYEARHTALDSRVAIKTLRTELLDEATVMARFEQEARSCAVLSHPNLVNVIDCGITEDKEPYLVMEFLEGPLLLEDVRADGKLNLEKFFEVFMQACSALEYAHNEGVVHRDLKPGNIIVTNGPEGTRITKIVDFGIAKIEDLGGNIQMLTQTGEVLGSPSYMSPEQCAGDLIDHRVDIYALGCVMYESIAGEQAFAGHNILEILEKHMSEKPKDLDAKLVEANAPGELKDVVMKCLEKNPQDRYQSCLEIHDSLKTIKENMLGSSPIEIAGLKLKLETLVAILLAVAVGLCIASYSKLIPDEISGRISGHAEAHSKRLINEADDRLAKTVLAIYGSEKKIGSSQKTLKNIYSELKSSETSLKVQVALFLEIMHIHELRKEYGTGIEFFKTNKNILKDFEAKLEKEIAFGKSNKDNLAADILALSYQYGALCYKECPVNNEQEYKQINKKADQLYQKALKITDEYNASDWTKATILKNYMDLQLWIQNKPTETIKSARELLRLAKPFSKWERLGWQYSGYYMQARAFERLQKWNDAEKNMVSATNIAIEWKSTDLIRDNFDLLIKWNKDQGKEEQMEVYKREKEKALAKIK